MVQCPHCGEPAADRQETCYACGRKVRARGYKAEHHTNPLVFVGAGLVVVLVLGGLWLIRSNSARKQAALLEEEETLRVQDSIRRASHEWQAAVRAAQEDEEARALAAQLDDIQSRFQTVSLRVAAHPTPEQEQIIHHVETGLEQLRNTVIVLASSPDSAKPALRDSIQAGMGQLESLTRELAGTS
jgi:hypothetical protein